MVKTNYVMSNLLEQRTNQIVELLLEGGKRSSKLERNKFEDKLVTILVSKFENVFTAPDGVLVTQDDEPTMDCFRGDDQGVSFMYFIRTGQYQVKIKSNFDAKSGSQPKIETKYLFDGDHFGEIGLLYNTMRTATVKSQNYGSLARLDKNDWGEI